jgi:hypothetical protein
LVFEFTGKIMKSEIAIILLASSLMMFAPSNSTRRAGTFTLEQNQVTPDQISASPQLPYWTTWTRPTSAAGAAATSTVYAEWDGFVSLDATNKPTGNSDFGSSLAVPTAGDSADATDGSFLIGGEGTTNNAYYSNVATSDIYSFGAVIAPQIAVPEYGIAGDQLNVLVQVQSYGNEIDPTQLTVNGVPASDLPDYSEALTKTDGGVAGGFGESFTNDYTWIFTLPVDPTSLQLNFGWGTTSAAFDSAVIDTQSVPASVPEPASIGLMALSGIALLKRQRRAHS